MMTDIRFNCPRCSQSLEAPPAIEGQNVECPTCHNPITVPESAGRHKLQLWPPRSSQSANILLPPPPLERKPGACEDATGHLKGPRQLPLDTGAAKTSLSARVEQSSSGRDRCPKCYRTFDIEPNKVTPGRSQPGGDLDWVLAEAGLDKVNLKCPYCGVTYELVGSDTSRSCSPPPSEPSMPETFWKKLAEQGSKVARVPCRTCGREILPDTAARTGGICAVCARKQEVDRQNARSLSFLGRFFGGGNSSKPGK